MTKQTTNLFRKIGLKVLEPSRLRFDEKQFLHVDFLDQDLFLKALEAYQQPPIFEISSTDSEGLNGYSKNVKSIYTVICPNRILLRFFEVVKETEQ